MRGLRGVPRWPPGEQPACHMAPSAGPSLGPACHMAPSARPSLGLTGQKSGRGMGHSLFSNMDRRNPTQPSFRVSQTLHHGEAGGATEELPGTLS